MKTLIFFYILVSLLSVSNALAQVKPGKACGTVYRGIPEAADGCGPMFLLDSTKYRVTGVPEHYLTTAGMKVKITYTPADTFYCGRGQAAIPTLHVLSIEPLKKRKNRK